MIVLFMANGTEEIEALTPLDLLRRAGLDVVTVGVGGKRIVGSHGIPIECDLSEEEWAPQENLQGVILPGGMPGTRHLDASAAVEKALHLAVEQNAWVGAICAAPLILGRRGLLQGRKATCYPGFEKELLGACTQGDPVCRDGRFITAKGAGVALDFALELVNAFCGEERAKALSEEIQCVR